MFAHAGVSRLVAVLRAFGAWAGSGVTRPSSGVHIAKRGLQHGAGLRPGDWSVHSERPIGAYRGFEYVSLRQRESDRPL